MLQQRSVHVRFFESDGRFAGRHYGIETRQAGSKVARGANRSRGSFALLDLRQQGDGDYVLGAVVAAPLAGAALTGDGMDEWCDFLRLRARAGSGTPV